MPGILKNGRQQQQQQQKKNKQGLGLVVRVTDFFKRRRYHKNHQLQKK
jgi:hypothetical protein